MGVNKFEPLTDSEDSDSEDINPLVPNIPDRWLQFIMGAPVAANNFEVSSDTPSTETDSEDGPPSLEEIPIPFFEVRCIATTGARSNLLYSQMANGRALPCPLSNSGARFIYIKPCQNGRQERP